MNFNNIFLIGPMGAGKSTVGTNLAAELGYEFFDTDKAIEEKTGVDLAWIYSVEGEDGFRIRENQIIAELTLLDRIVLSTGGGSVVDSESRKLLASRGFVIHLSTSMPEQYSRTLNNRRNRPQLQVDDLEKQLEKFRDERQPLYEEISDLSIMTDGKSVKKVVTEILQHLGL